MTENDHTKAINELETDLGIPSGFYQELVKEDDWSFIIKLHALLEAAITRLLTEIMGLPLKAYFPKDSDRYPGDLSDVFSWLELSNQRTGKIAFVKTLYILDEEQRRFIRSLSELRNKLVHDVQNIGFTFEQHLQSMDKNQLSNFAEHLGYYIPGNSNWRGRMLSRKEFVKQRPKFAIWFSAENVLSEIAHCLKYFRATDKDIRHLYFEQKSQKTTTIPSSEAAEKMLESISKEADSENPNEGDDNVA